MAHILGARAELAGGTAMTVSQRRCSFSTAPEPGPPDDPFDPPPMVDQGLVESQTAERVTASDDGERETGHAFGWGRAGSGIEAVELRTDLASARVPVIATGGFFVIVATGSDPELIAHATSDDDRTTP